MELTTKGKKEKAKAKVKVKELKAGLKAAASPMNHQSRKTTRRSSIILSLSTLSSQMRVLQAPSGNKRWPRTMIEIRLLVFMEPRLNPLLGLMPQCFWSLQRDHCYLGSPQHL